ncbi:MAG: hypothetical protein JOZ19_01410 [Rubrobacter sp.]|nr:hypothetical protein [Rubrobacter sp.]
MGISLQLVHQLIDKGELEANRDEETKLWLIEASSIHHGLRKLWPELQGFEANIAVAINGVQENRFFDYRYLLGIIDCDYFLVLMFMILGTITVMTAVDIIATALL